MCDNGMASIFDRPKKLGDDGFEAQLSDDAGVFLGGGGGRGRERPWGFCVVQMLRIYLFNFFLDGDAKKLN